MSPRAAILLLILFAVTLAAPAQTMKCGADAPSTIATDRPQITSSGIVVPCGSLQFENGFRLTGNGGQHLYDLPETSVRLGVAGQTELRFGVPNYFAATASGASSGWSDLSAGFKQQLGPVKAFDVSLIPSVSFPTGAAALFSHGYDPSVQLPWARSLSKSWTLAGMFSLMWPTQTILSGDTQRNLTGQASVFFDRQIAAPWDAYIEYSGAFPERGGPQHILDFGTAYKLSPHQQLDFHCGFGLSAAVPDYTIGFGYSVRFQAFRSR